MERPLAYARITLEVHLSSKLRPERHWST